jgi:hypothetical protein
MTEVDLTSLGSYTELPGGNVRLPRGYTSILGPIVSGIHESCILKGHIHWRYRAEMEEIRNDKVRTWVTRCVFDKIDQNRAQPVFCQNYYITLKYMLLV